jgi:hypothetical protein
MNTDDKIIRCHDCNAIFNKPIGLINPDRKPEEGEVISCAKCGILHRVQSDGAIKKVKYFEIKLLCWEYPKVLTHLVKLKQKHESELITEILFKREKDKLSSLIEIIKTRPGSALNVEALKDLLNKLSKKYKDE